MTVVREPAVAGQFYPEDPGELRTLVDGFLEEAACTDEEAPKALIAPHAGYVYSGPIAASAYAQLRPVRARIRRVVLLAPSHQFAFRGLAASSADAFHTPLGDIPVDAAAVARAAAKGAAVVAEVGGGIHRVSQPVTPAGVTGLPLEERRRLPFTDPCRPCI